MFIWGSEGGVALPLTVVISFQFTLILCRERRGEPQNVKGVEEASQQWAVIQERGRGVISKVLSAFGSCPGLLGAQGSRSVRDRYSRKRPVWRWASAPGERTLSVWIAWWPPTVCLGLNPGICECGLI